jgi:hypothetical protein
MADELLTLLDIVKLNGRDAEVGIVDETTKAIPEVSGMTYRGTEIVQIPGVGAARRIDGTTYEASVRVGLPTVGFRRGNQGTDRTKARYEKRMTTTHYMNPRWGVDVMVAKSAKDDTPEDLLFNEAVAHTRAAMQACASQFYYGVTLGALGFPGLADVVNSTMVADAGGTTASTGSSVWAVKFGPEFVRWVFGNGGQYELSDVDLRDMEDADGKKYTGFHQELWNHVGLQCFDWRGVARLKDITADSGKTLDDDKLGDLMELFPAGIVPDVLFMTRRSRRQLQQSRTATNATGAPAPVPTEFEGVPIAVTESLLNTETLT